MLLSFSLGLLIGLERGWKEISEHEHYPILGIRTFGLIGLFGGLTGFLGEIHNSPLIPGLGLSAFIILIIAAHFKECGHDSEIGLTTSMAAIVTFTLGILPPMGYTTEASAFAVLTMVLLSVKPYLYDIVKKIEAAEIHAAMKMLLISVVLLPVLPNEGYGPWNALNPYELWLLVVLITGISFAGYFAVRIAGPGKGFLITGLLGGFVSSTALTLSFARLGRKYNLKNVLAAGVLIACGTMFPRMIIEVSVVNTALLPKVVPALVVTGVGIYAGMLLFAFSGTRSKKAEDEDIPLHNPFQIAPALQFAALLALIMLLSEASTQWFGETGLYILSFLSGLTDVDAITLSVAKMSIESIDHRTATFAIMIAAATNTLVKGLLVLFIGGKEMGLRVLGVFTASLLLGGSVVLFF
ncbi:MgtC/SapB family protein [Limisalsivibrio acetivorans]|uniref:MgtC/SapB family protein n=1 Tax=Limisalsivibrio acetivorans TaxID=1304888 RepID=UPI0003B7AC5A|nr:MgtC/SapB family protein [Limisalsivibrio acetivorans]